jgi:hypothetical protein
MELIVAYLVGIVVLAGLFAVRAPHEELRVVLAISIFWPISIVLIAFMFLLEAVKWDMDLAKGTKMFGVRKSTNPMVKGFAFTFLYQEFQFYTVKKA